MASEFEIKQGILLLVGAFYSLWTIGLTDNPDRRREELGSTTIWHQWDADTKVTAGNVEKYFLEKGMQGSPDDTGWKYVYIFKQQL